MSPDKPSGHQDPAFLQALAQVTQLVNTFQRHPHDYSEAQARIDFIDKFWIALGWDVNHQRQTNPYEQEVKVERGVEISGRARRADYAFLAPNFRDVRFFVEAKRPGAGIGSADDCFQVVRYGWNSHVPLSVLTDFQHFFVLDCRFRPDIDSAPHRVIPDLKFQCAEYTDPEVFAKIYYLFGREAVAKGSLERYAEALPKPTGKAVQRGLVPSGRLQNIDDSFLQELEEFRAGLAKSFKKKNPKLGGEDLTEVTQRTLDRLVFMRFLEDKLIETDPLVESFGSRGSVWQDFVAASRRLDRVYNGIIFKEHALLDSPSFKVDEEAFEAIRERLAHNNSPYAFNYIPIHILGSIYERFLGNTIVATEKQARVEPKPEVRKAGGVYYTPEYIVRYIVENTVGKLIADKSPEQIAEMRFADIACGSGSFLLGVFDTLLRRISAFYNQSKKNRALGLKAGCVEGEDGKLHLNLRQKREILVRNVYGVDLDQQAVEVAQLSLYLKLLEEETAGSVRHYQLEFGEQLLPDLKKNIVCGNSLVDWDILDGKLFDTDEERELKPLAFEDAFPEVMQRGGFDVVVGNPPWLMAGYHLDSSLDYLRQKYQTAKGKFDVYYLFIERAFAVLKKQSSFGMIVPNKFFHTSAAKSLRALLASNPHLQSIVDFGDERIFEGATNYSCILIFRPEPKKTVAVAKAKARFSAVTEFSIARVALTDKPWHLSQEDNRSLFAKLERLGQRLETITSRFGSGVQSGADRILLLEPAEAAALGLEEPTLSRTYRGRDVRRYFTAENPRVLVFPYSVVDNEFAILEESTLRKYPGTLKHLLRNKRKLEHRVWFDKGATELSGKWYGLMYLDSYRVFSSPHLLTPCLSNRSNFALGTGFLFSTGTAGVTSVVPSKEMREDILYLLGVLNSKLISHYATSHSPIFSGAYFKFSSPYLKGLPIRRIHFSDKNDVRQHHALVSMVKTMIDTRERLAAAKSARDTEHLSRKCEALDRQIDQLVYELYELTPEEIALVEGTTATVATAP